MHNNGQIPDEEKELRKIAPTLFSIEKQHCFTVPEGYFNAFASDVVEMVALSNSEETIDLGQAKAEPQFVIPESYFESFADNLQHRIEQEELAEMAPTLFALEKKEVFTAPKGYFDALPSLVQEKCIESSRSRTGEWVEQLRFWFYRLTLPVAVACLAVYFGLSYMGNTELEALTAEEISHALVQDVTDEAILVEQLSEEDIEQLGEEMMGEAVLEELNITDVEAVVIENESTMPEDEVSVEETPEEKEEDVKEDEIIDYLMENDVDLSSIVSEM